MHSSIDPYRRKEDKDDLKEVLDKHSDVFVEEINSVDELREFNHALAIAKLLVVPDYKKPIEHIRDLSLAAKKGYKMNATQVADKQHSAARTLAGYHGYDWKDDVVSKDHQREGELGSN